MKTDYKNLNLFETLAVVLIAAGLVLTGLVIYSGFNAKQQSHVVAAMQMFDIHEEVSRDWQQAEKLFTVEDKFYNQFYVAFTQVAAIDINPQPIHLAKISIGRVAGASVDLTDRGKNCSPPPDIIPYSFAPPNWQALKQQININLQY